MQEAIAQHSAAVGRDPAGQYTVTIAPHLFVRTSGLPAEYSLLSDHSAAASLASLQHAERAAKDIVERACKSLEALVPNGFDADRAIGRALISIKRDLFNFRGIGEERHRAGVDWLAAADRELVEKAHSAIAAFGRARSTYLQSYTKEVRRTRLAALQGTEDRLFRSGLAVTNPSLFDLLETVGTGKKRLSEKDHNQLSASALRYLLRVSRKTSPIATFGPVWTTVCGQERFVGQSIAVPTRLRCTRNVRAALVQRLIQPLLEDWRNLSGDAQVIVNPTLELGPDGIGKWWARRFDEAPNAIIAGTGLDRVSGRSKAIAAFGRLLDAHPDASMTADELRSLLGGRDTNPRNDRIEAALQSAWRTQLLLPVLYHHDDALVWAREAANLFTEKLSAAIHPHIDALAQLCEDESLPTRALAESYEDRFARLQEAVGGQANDVPRPIITVDAHAEADDFRHPAIPPGLIATLASLTQAMPALAEETPSAQLRMALGRFFDERHPPGCAGKEPLSPFLQAYFDAGGETQSQIFQRSIGLASSPNQPEPENTRSSGEIFLDRLAHRAQSEASIELTSSELSEAVQETPQTDFGYVSLQFHMQSIDAGRSFVLNQIFPGSCSTLTRFLRPETAEHQRAYLRETLDGRVPLEINAAFGFNASSHSHLVDHALAFPPIPEPAGIESVDVKSLWIERDPASGDLRVTDSDGRVHAPIYVAALNPMSLPKQYQALHALCVNHWRHSGLSGSIIRRALEGFDGFRALARVTIDDLVVLRRSWIVSSKGLPDLDLGSADFFRAFNEWADGYDLPVHLFYQANVLPIPDDGQPPEDRSKRARPRLYKPMPLDRNCALGVELFLQAARKSSQGLLLSEALPAPTDQSYTRDGAAVAAELALEITCTRSRND